MAHPMVLKSVAEGAVKSQPKRPNRPYKSIGRQRLANVSKLLGKALQSTAIAAVRHLPKSK